MTTKSLTEIKTISAHILALINCPLKKNYANKLLSYVMRGIDENDLAALIKARPKTMQDWGGKSIGIVTDEAGREVFAMALHYALWAGDWHHVQIFKQCMTATQYKCSIEEFDNNGGLGSKNNPGYYGKSFDYQPVLTAYKNCKELTEKIRSDGNSSELSNQLDDIWNLTYAELANCPTFFIQHITTTMRTLMDDNGNPPDFENESTLVRSLYLDDGKHVFARGRGIGIFGLSFGILRSNWPLARTIGGCGKPKNAISFDYVALCRLVETINKKRELLVR